MSWGDPATPTRRGSASNARGEGYARRNETGGERRAGAYGRSEGERTDRDDPRRTYGSPGGFDRTATGGNRNNGAPREFGSRPEGRDGRDGRDGGFRTSTSRADGAGSYRPRDERPRGEGPRGEGPRGDTRGRFESSAPRGDAGNGRSSRERPFRGRDDGARSGGPASYGRSDVARNERGFSAAQRGPRGERPFSGNDGRGRPPRRFDGAPGGSARDEGRSSASQAWREVRGERSDPRGRSSAGPQSGGYEDRGAVRGRDGDGRPRTWIDRPARDGRARFNDDRPRDGERPTLHGRSRDAAERGGRFVRPDRSGPPDRSGRPSRPQAPDRAQTPERDRNEDRPRAKRVPIPPPPRSAPPRQIRPWESLGWTREQPEPSDESVESVDPDATVRKRDRSAKLPETVTAEISKAVGAKRGVRISMPLLEASKAFERERYGDALRILRPLLEEAPDVAAVRELTGLALYRQEKWPEAIRHLERFAELTGSVEQNPVLADCHRALKHYGRVVELWEELAASSPSADLVTEGRIVMAGTLGDQGKLEEAIRILERAPSGGKRARGHHVRLWYALADLYERAGDLPRARDMFKRVAEHDPDLADVSARLANLA